MPSQTELSVDVTMAVEVDLPPQVTEDAVASLTTYVLKAEGQTGDWQLGIRFVDDPTMQQAHIDFMGIDSSTDIMTFPYEADEFDLGIEQGEEPAEQGGDLMISVDRAAEHALDAGWSTDQELFFIIVHGVLHILGWDDRTVRERTRMLDRQQVLLDCWERARHLG